MYPQQTDSQAHIACSSGSCLRAYEMVLSQKGCYHKELLPPSSHLCHDPSLPAHSCSAALHPLPLLIVLHAHESRGKTPHIYITCASTRKKKKKKKSPREYSETVWNCMPAAVSTLSLISQGSDSARPSRSAVIHQVIEDNEQWRVSR